MSGFPIEGEFIELIKLMKASGVCATGGHAKMMVEEGEIQVNGEVETRKRRKLVAGDRVDVGDQHITIQKKA